MKTKIAITVDVPDELVGRLIQHLRDFDAAHVDCTFAIYALGGALTSAEFDAILDGVEPPFAFRHVDRKH